MNKERLARKIQDVIAWSQIEKERYVDMIDKEKDARLAALRENCQHDWSKWHEQHDEMCVGVMTTYRRVCSVCKQLEVVKERPTGDVVESHSVRYLP